MLTNQSMLSDVLVKFEQILINDEIFMRLVKYPPESDDNGNGKHPLDESLPSVVDDSDEYWELVDDRIRRGQKSSKMENETKVVVYLHEGRRRPYWGFHNLAIQEIKIAIYAPESFESDMRISKLSDRINYLINLHKEIGAFGMVEYIGGNSYQAPQMYRMYEHTYKVHVPNGRV